MNPGQRADERRAALALVAATADADRDAVTAILGPGWQGDRSAVIASTLAAWLAVALHRLGHDDPAAASRDAIAVSVADEAREAGP